MTLAADGTLEASFKALAEGFYRIDLPRRDGSLQSGSPEYTIDVLADQPPAITLRKPGRDAKVTSIEEVFTEFEAEDDYGVGRAELVYSVNGAPEKTLVLHRGAAKKSLTMGHTFFLEELTLEPGDFISYFARATDQGSPVQTTSTDIYFLEVRPFDREYRQAEQRGGGGGGGGGADGALSEQQRQIIAATFKLARDRARTSDKQHAEDIGVLALVQGRLQQQVQSLMQRMSNRGVLDPDSEFAKTADSLRAAATEMIAAREKLEARKAREALPPEQGALKHLQRAEAAFRNVQVSFEQGGQGGGGAMNAEDLADLFELELDKLKNQYETVQRGQEREADNQVDEAVERLRELARRQEQEIERMRQLAGRLPNQGGGGGRGGSQQELARQTEELARRLERLAREQSSAAMQDTARRLQDAANAMRRASGGGQEGSLGESTAALERLRDARRRLETNQSGRVERNIREAQRLAGEMARAQEKIAEEVEQQLGQPGGGQGGARRGRLMERKDELANQVSELEGQLDRMAQEARGSKKDAARKLQEAADSIRDRKLRDKIRYSKGVLAAGAAEQSRQLESEIGSDLQALGRKLDQAGTAAGPSDADKRTAQLERMRDLARNLESLQERLQEKAGQGRSAGERSAGERPEGERSAGERSGGERSGREQSGGERSAGERSEGERGQGGDGQSGEGQQSGGARGGQREGLAGGAQGGPGGGTPDNGLAAGGPPRFTQGDARQVRRELRERLREAEALGRELGAGGPYDLRDVVRGMRRFEDEAIYGEPRGLARLVGSVVEGLKSAEFALRREIEGPDRAKLFQAGSQDLPPGWQRLVEEYYRSLSKKSDNSSR
jgi:molybdenum-dependent DNA-binding transcriptional regulator ModE